MRAVPVLSAEELRAYLASSVGVLIERTRDLGERLTEPLPGLDLSPYQLIGSTLQGSFGHVGDFDALLSLRVRSGGLLGAR